MWLVPYKKDDKLYFHSDSDAFISHELISVELKGQLRSLYLANLIIRPVDYNPVRGIIKVTKSVDFMCFAADLLTKTFLSRNLKM